MKRYSPRQLKRTLGKYDTRETTVAVGTGLELTIVETVDAYALLDRLLDREPDSHPRFPYWAEVWPAALGLSRWLFERRLPAVDAVELGCGLGLVGITLARLGWRVEATDYVEDALIFTTHNAVRNRAGPGHQVAYLDWRHPVGKPRECLVASDIAYEPRDHPNLNRLLKSLLKPGGRLYLSDPRRPVAANFISGLRDRGFDHSRETVAVRWRGQEQGIDIHVLTSPPAD